MSPFWDGYTTQDAAISESLLFNHFDTKCILQIKRRCINFLSFLRDDVGDWYPSSWRFIELGNLTVRERPLNLITHFLEDNVLFILHCQYHGSWRPSLVRQLRQGVVIKIFVKWDYWMCWTSWANSFRMSNPDANGVTLSRTLWSTVASSGSTLTEAAVLTAEFKAAKATR